MTRSNVHRCAKLIGLCALFLTGAAHATVYSGNPGNYRTLLEQLAPGDRLELAAGTYTDGLTLTGISGTSAAPIVITGPRTGAAAIFKPRSCCNTIQLDQNSYLEIRNLTVDGQGGVGVDGVNARNTTHHVLIEGLTIINHDDEQATVGLATHGPAWNWVIRGNRILGAGTGMYLGNSDGSAPFVAGLIEQNLLIDTIGYNIEIKHQLSRAGISGLPAGDQVTIIRRNVFSKANNASTGGNARPNLLVGHFPLSGAGSNDRYEIYGNFFYQNPTEALFQGEGNIALYTNLFVNDFGPAINVISHNDRPRTVTIFHNTVVAADRGINVSGGAAGFTQRIIANAVFADPPISGPNALQNIVDSHAAAGNYLNAPGAPIGSLDLFPKSGALQGAAVDLSLFTVFTDGVMDFDGRSRQPAFRGAHSAEGANTGWKPSLSSPPPSPGGAQPPTITFSAQPVTVPIQGSSTLNWSASGADACLASGAWSGSRDVSGSQTVGPLNATSVYALTCTNGSGGSASKSVTVTVTSAVPAPTVNLSANPTSVAVGATSLLSWTTSNAMSCTASGGWTGNKSVPGGSQTVGPLTASTVFDLACTGAGGTTQDSATVSLLAAPSVNLAANPTTVGVGGQSTLTWSSPNATGCAASGGWAGNKASNGSQSTGALTTTISYTLVCTGPGGTSAPATVTVSVSPGGGGGADSGSEEGGGGGGGVGTIWVLSLFAAVAARCRARLRLIPGT